jgi:hypothetical protein
MKMKNGVDIVFHDYEIDMSPEGIDYSYSDINSTSSFPE